MFYLVDFIYILGSNRNSRRNGTTRTSRNPRF